MKSLKDYLIVKAPFDGTITQRNIHPGALVTVGSKSDAVADAGAAANIEITAAGKGS